MWSYNNSQSILKLKLAPKFVRSSRQSREVLSLWDQLTVRQLLQVMCFIASAVLKNKMKMYFVKACFDYKWVNKDPVSSVINWNNLITRYIRDDDLPHLDGHCSAEPGISQHARIIHQTPNVLFRPQQFFITGYTHLSILSFSNSSHNQHNSSQRGLNCRELLIALTQNALNQISSIVFSLKLNHHRGQPEEDMRT